MGGKMLVGEQVHVVPAIAPVDTTTVTVNTDVVGVKEYSAIQFVISFGVITGDTIVCILYESTNTTASGNAVAGKYRKSSALGTDVMGALTTLTTSGVTIAASDDNKVLLIDVDPATLTDGYPYVFVACNPGGSMSVCLISAVALLLPKYPQSVNISAVD